MDTNHQLAELDAVLINGFDPIAPAHTVTAGDETVLLDKAILGLDRGVDPGDQFDLLFKNAHIEPNRAGDSVLAKQLERDLDALLKPFPVRSATAPATVANTIITDEQMDKALDAAEDNGELSAMTRWLAGQVWHGKNASELIAHAQQSKPAAAELMKLAATNLGLA
jgi:hypothetical protein